MPTNTPSTGGSQPGSSGSGGSSGNGGTSGSGSGGSAGSGGGSGASGGTYIMVGSGAQSDGVSVFRLNSDGTLVAAQDSPFAVPGSGLALSNKSLVGAEGSNVALLSIDPASGALSRTASTTLPGGASTGANEIAGIPGTIYVGSNNGIYAYTTAANQLSLVPGSPFGAGTDMFSNRDTFKLTALDGFLFSDVQRFHNTTIDIWRITPASALVQTDSAGAGGTAPLGLATSPDGKFVYDSDSSDKSVSFSFDPNTGKLGSAQTEDVRLGIVAAVDPGGKYLYVHDVRDNNGNELQVFAINQSTGALTPVPGSPFATGGQGGLTGLGFDPNGRFLLVTHTGTADDVTVLATTSATGTITPLSPSYVLKGQGGTRDVVAIAF